MDAPSFKFHSWAKRGLSGGQIGGIVGGAVGLHLILFLCICLYHRRVRRAEATSPYPASEQATSPDLGDVFSPPYRYTPQLDEPVSLGQRPALARPVRPYASGEDVELDERLGSS